MHHHRVWGCLDLARLVGHDNNLLLADYAEGEDTTRGEELYDGGALLELVTGPLTNVI